MSHKSKHDTRTQKVTVIRLVLFNLRSRDRRIASRHPAQSSHAYIMQNTSHTYYAFLNISNTFSLSLSLVLANCYHIILSFPNEVLILSQLHTTYNAGQWHAVPFILHEVPNIYPSENRKHAVSLHPHTCAAYIYGNLETTRDRKQTL